MLSALVTSTTLMICRGQRSSKFRSDQITYVDGAEAGTVTGGHVLVKGIDRVGTAHLTELLVHVVGAGARVVADPDAEVLDLERALLVDLERSGGKSSHGDAIHTTLTLTISPLPFLTFRSLVRKNQNRDLATTWLGAKMRMR